MLADIKQRTGIVFRPFMGALDYWQDHNGAAHGGRALEPPAFDGRLLGKGFDRLAWPLPKLMVFNCMMLMRAEAARLLVSMLVLGLQLVSRHLLDGLRHRRGTRLVERQHDMRVGGCEIFGLDMCIVPFQTHDEAVEKVNGTPFGLATGIFTSHLDAAFATVRRLEVDGVHINKTSSGRVDNAYDGSKDSGFGDEELCNSRDDRGTHRFDRDAVGNWQRKEKRIEHGK